MPNTTNYSFPTPADTDLVKNGADAIRDLGDAVDTAMNTALGTKKAGMVLLNTTSFSGVSSQSINSVFNSTYDNYFIMYKNTTSSGSPVLTLKLRAAGVDTSTNYGSQRIYSQGAGVFGERDGVGTDELYVADLANTGQAINATQLYVYSPNLAAATTFSATNVMLLSTTLYSTANVGFQNSSTQFDGFTLIVSTGTFGGTVSIFGVAK